MPVVRGKNIDPLYTAEVISERNIAMAEEIAKGPLNDLLVIAVLKGSFIFAADLIRAMHSVGLAPEVEFITLSSYGTGTVSQGVKIIKDIDSDVHGRDVLLIDDILESGRTLRFAKELMLERGAKSVTIAVLLDKKVKRQTELEADYVGFECPDYFVVGYGMDVAYAFRELPFVGIVTGDA
ncbi:MULTISPECIES: hypoxanthine phosphoribosyltransferase [unclassified Rhizobium]|uniref:hypoxanthine phosphoribosyltransferase n=1 Tax=unclassified Rhizobium TaxID=2613769 RepID=UPI00071514AC|nr:MULTISPECIES: hypoxanthine phosphoribosyltransferase [unclassified Rhizobium]KQT01758.1 hypoxanthine phosphoribosyltransferase [Rhizobium sp. Leaf386]KQT03284.1 hypoxanthine phosphoribosyltransferase [Rhizobium sp. Leaf391]KQU08307.1 hypoxanthine phosphoribosyltransferase [Rhizobium sp. Leaf453]